MTVLDASVVIAHLNPGDPNHQLAGELLAEAAELTMHAVTMAEILVGAARAGRAAELQHDLTAIGIVVAVADESEPLRVAELRARSGLKLPDCYPLALAGHLSDRLATFDVALRKASGREHTPVA